MTARVIGKNLSLKELGEDNTLWVGDLGVSRNGAFFIVRDVTLY